MKTFTTILLVLSVITGSAQNVGVGTASPSEKLDVNGNINLNGTIKVNGEGGQPNQVLTKNANNALAWADLSGYKNTATFLATGNWIVPAGVTRIAVEAWGAGGGGSNYGGGGGGGYIVGVIDVTPGAQVDFIIGTGGMAGTTVATSGQATTVNTGGIFLTGNGGVGNVARGNGGNFTGIGTLNFFGINGQNGTASRSDYQQFSATNFAELISGGNGGNGGGTEYTGGEGHYRIYNITGASVLRNTAGTFGKVPGGGGGAGYYMTSTATSTAGFQGGNGLVSIHY